MATVALVTAVGCGGKAQTGGASSSGSSNGGDGGPTPLDGAVDAPDSTTAHRHVTIGCPAAPPSSTAACTHEGQFCEYGSDWDPRCNTLLACIGGEWTVPGYVGGATTCGSTVAPTGAPNPAECPAARVDVDAGQACSGSSTCAYNASNCMCDHYCRQFPIPPPPCNPDAGVSQYCCDLTGSATWHCFDGVPYCASNRPSVGDPCTSGDPCAITPADECGQTLLACNGTAWQVNMETCPISTARAKRDINYLGQDDILRLRDALLGVKLATYKYKLGDPSEHLGFIIEDMQAGSPAVLASRERVDLYGYLSMAVAAIQQQQRQIDLLEQRLERVEHGRCKEP